MKEKDQEKSTIETLYHVPMKSLGRERTVRVYMPPNYGQDRCFPVLYMQDGQNLFDVKTSQYGSIWDVGKTMDQMVREQQFPGIIIVGIDSDKRKRYLEYSPWKNPKIGKLMPHALETDGLGGEGFQYIDFIVKELKPYIDDHYKTLPQREKTAIAGSSMGALISVAAAVRYPEVFSMSGSFSSAAYFNKNKLFHYIMKHEKKYDIKWYIDTGTKETSNPKFIFFPWIYLKTSWKLKWALKKSGYAGEDIHYKVFKHDYHSEKCWSVRFKYMVDFFWSTQ